MAGLPAASNVFGYLGSSIGLGPVAAALCSRLGMSPDEVKVYRSGFNGAETLRVETSSCSLEAHPAQLADTWHFNGAVAGAPHEIFATLLPIALQLTWAGFSARFEIYDESFEFVAECPGEPPPAR
jgi:hypothetical protein